MKKNETFKVLCIKDCYPVFTKDNVYEVKTCDETLDSPIRFFTKDDIGSEENVIAEGSLKESEMFNLHFKLL